MVLPTSTFIPVRSISFRFATIPMTVAMQEPSDADVKSVGENASPFPWLSTGASVMMEAPEGP